MDIENGLVEMTHPQEKMMTQQAYAEKPMGMIVDVSDPLLSGSLHPRLAWMMVYKETNSVQAVCARFSISRKTFYKWLKRYQQANGDSASLGDRSRRPHRFPHATSPEKVELLFKIRQETGYGQRRLRTYLEENYNISISERTIWKLLKQIDADALSAQG
jgi:transposase